LRDTVWWVADVRDVTEDLRRAEQKWAEALAEVEECPMTKPPERIK
jgi:hypothetical protein